MGKRQRILDSDGEARFQKAVELVKGDPKKIKEAVRAVITGGKHFPVVGDAARRTFLFGALEQKLHRRLLRKQRRLEKTFGEKAAAEMRRDGKRIKQEQEREAAHGTPIT